EHVIEGLTEADDRSEVDGGLRGTILADGGVAIEVALLFDQSKLGQGNQQSPATNRVDMEAYRDVLRSSWGLTQFFEDAEFDARYEGLRLDVARDEIGQAVERLDRGQCGLVCCR